MDDPRIGDVFICTKGCMCGCGLTVDKKYTVEKIANATTNEVYFKEIKERDDGERYHYYINTDTIRNYKLEKIEKKELQLELF